MDYLENKFVEVAKIKKEVHFHEPISEIALEKFEKKYKKKFDKKELLKKFNENKNGRIKKLQLFLHNLEEAIFTYIYMTGINCRCFFE